MSRTVKFLFTALVISTMLSGCSSGSLDTTLRHDVIKFSIKRWNTQKSSWEATNDSVTVTTDWQFQFISDQNNISIIKTLFTLNGCYTITWDNSTNEKVDVHVGKLTFIKDDGKAAGGVLLNDNFTIDPQSTSVRTGTFLLTLSDIKMSQTIRMINSWVEVSYQH